MGLYWREQLNAKEKKLYDYMVQQFYALKEHFYCKNCSFANVENAYNSILNDHPLLYYLPNKFICIRNKFNNNIYDRFLLKLKNLYTIQQIITYDNALEKVKKTLSEIIKDRSEIEIEKYICQYFLKNIYYRVDNIYNQNAGMVLVNNVGQCSGIAKAAKLMLGWCGIDSIVVNGFAIDPRSGQTNAHAWNIVRVENQLYHLDMTFMLNANNKNSKPYRYLFFNYTDEEIAVTHKWDCKIPTCDHFYKDKQLDAFTSKSLMLNQNKIIYNLEEVYRQLKIQLQRNENELMFVSQIPIMDKARLMSLLKHCCGMVMSELKVNKKMYINIEEDVVSICW